MTFLQSSHLTRRCTASSAVVIKHVEEVCWASLKSDQNLRGPHVARQQPSIDICCPRPTSAANRRHRCCCRSTGHTDGHSTILWRLLHVMHIPRNKLRPWVLTPGLAWCGVRRSKPNLDFSYGTLRRFRGIIASRRVRRFKLIQSVWLLRRRTSPRGPVRCFTLRRIRVNEALVVYNESL